MVHRCLVVVVMCLCLMPSAEAALRSFREPEAAVPPPKTPDEAAAAADPEIGAESDAKAAAEDEVETEAEAKAAEDAVASEEAQEEVPAAEASPEGEAETEAEAKVAEAAEASEEAPEEAPAPKGPTRGHEEDEAVTAQHCEDLCKYAEGMDKGSCMNECSVHTDVAQNTRHGVKNFVKDQVTNKKGGKKMEAHAEKEFGMDIADCIPQIDVDEPPTFDEVDTSKDGIIDSDEALAYGNKACIPDAFMMQLFEETDLDQDKQVTREEFDRSGEDTALEEEIDAAFDKPTQGDDEINTVDLPDFDVFDKNEDGVLDETELGGAFRLEMQRRNPKASAEQVTDMQHSVKGAIEKIDTNGDGVIDREEYNKAANNKMGDELGEQAQADEDLPELDGTKPAPNAETAFEPKVEPEEAAETPEPAEPVEPAEPAGPAETAEAVEDTPSAEEEKEEEEEAHATEQEAPATEEQEEEEKEEAPATEEPASEQASEETAEEAPAAAEQAAEEETLAEEADPATDPALELLVKKGKLSSGKQLHTSQWSQLVTDKRAASLSERFAKAQSAEAAFLRKFSPAASTFPVFALVQTEHHHHGHRSNTKRALHSFQRRHHQGSAKSGRVSSHGVHSGQRVSGHEAGHSEGALRHRQHHAQEHHSMDLRRRHHGQAETHVEARAQTLKRHNSRNSARSLRMRRSLALKHRAAALARVTSPGSPASRWAAAAATFALRRAEKAER